MGSLKIWNGTAWEVASQQGPAGPVVLPGGGTTGQVLAKQSGSDYDTAWRHDGVASFPTAAARTAAIPAPALNQLTMLDSRPGVQQYWSGTAWVDTAPFVQSGRTLVTLDANGEALITYPVPFGAVPVVVATVSQLSNSVPYFQAPPNQTATSVVIGFRVSNTGAAAPGGTQLYVNWIAVGPRT